VASFLHVQQKNFHAHQTSNIMVVIVCNRADEKQTGNYSQNLN